MNVSDTTIIPAVSALVHEWVVSRISLQVEYKSTYKLRSTEDAFAALEDNTVTLSTMKASKFFVVFETEITTWEKTLSIVSEMLEMVLQV